MGYLFFFEGCVFAWNTKTHTYITTATNHSEYVSGGKAGREAKASEKIFWL